MELTDIQKLVLSQIQAKLPVVHRPYAQIGETIGATEDQVMAAIAELRESGVIRRIGAIFDSYRLGYRSTLCAIAVPEERVEEVAALISVFPNVTHNYLREDRYNIWFTLIAPSSQRIEEILAEIAEKSGIDDILNLPATHLFKIRVDFDFTGDRASRTEELQVVHPNETESVSLDDAQIALVKVLQTDLTSSSTPFADVAEKVRALGFDVDENWVLANTAEWVENSVIRRFGAAIKHHKTGYTHNAMGVWTVPVERLDELGPVMASFKEVSHGYARPSFPTWPANTYTMIHGKSREDCEAVARKIQEATGLPEPRLLYSTKEFKKISMKYFMEGL